MRLHHRVRCSPAARRLRNMSCCYGVVENSGHGCRVSRSSSGGVPVASPPRDRRDPMRTLEGNVMTPQAMIDLFQKHVNAELAGDLDTTMATMSDDPHLNHVPTMAGAVGRD